MERLPIIPLLLLSVLCRAGEPDWSEDLALDIVPAGESAPGPANRKKSRPPPCQGGEPEVREVVAAAWREAGLLPQEDRSRRSRVRASGWLPRLSGGVSKDTGDRWDYRYEPGTPRVDQLHQDDGLSWDVGLVWDLSRTVFQPEELQVAREASRRARERMDLAAEVIRLYFQRRRLIGDRLPPAGSRPAGELLEANAVLDAFTGGRFHDRWCGVAP